MDGATMQITSTQSIYNATEGDCKFCGANGLIKNPDFHLFKEQVLEMYSEEIVRSCDVQLLWHLLKGKNSGHPEPTPAEKRGTQTIKFKKPAFTRYPSNENLRFRDLYIPSHEVIEDGDIPDAIPSSVEHAGLAALGASHAEFARRLPAKMDFLWMTSSGAFERAQFIISTWDFAWESDGWRRPEGIDMTEHIEWRASFGPAIEIFATTEADKNDAPAAAVDDDDNDKAGSSGTNEPEETEEKKEEEKEVSSPDSPASSSDVKKEEDQSSIDSINDDFEHINVDDNGDDESDTNTIGPNDHGEEDDDSRSVASSFFMVSSKDKISMSDRVSSAASISGASEGEGKERTFQFGRCWTREGKFERKIQYPKGVGHVVRYAS